MKRLIVLTTLIMALFALPVAAQEGSQTQTITVDGFTFSIDWAWATNVNISRYAGDPPEQGPGFSDAPHIQFALYNELGLPHSTFATVAGIRLYNVEDLEPYRFLAMQADALKLLLDERPDLDLFNAVSESGTMADVLPYIPVLPHGQILRARAHYVETDEVAGIAYITYSNAAPEPFLSHHFTYTFQGVSADGQYYFSASLPFTTDVFPSEPEPIDPDDFYPNWPEYLAESIATLNAAEPAAFVPPLETLDGLVQTFSFEAE